MILGLPDLGLVQSLKSLRISAAALFCSSLLPLELAMLPTERSRAARALFEAFLPRLGVADPSPPGPSDLELRLARDERFRFDDTFSRT